MEKRSYAAFGVFYFERDTPFCGRRCCVHQKRPATRWNCTQLKKTPAQNSSWKPPLTAAGIFYSKSDEIYIDEEQMLYVIYEIEV